MNNMKINIPEGFEIDKENSSLETGDIVFKKVEKKYSSEFYKLSRKTPMPLGSWDVRHIC